MAIGATEPETAEEPICIPIFSTDDYWRAIRWCNIECLPPTHREWLQSVRDLKAEAKQAGRAVREIPIKPELLAHYARRHGLSAIGASELETYARRVYRRLNAVRKRPPPTARKLKLQRRATIISR